MPYYIIVKGVIQTEWNYRPGIVHRLDKDTTGISLHVNDNSLSLLVSNLKSNNN